MMRLCFGEGHLNRKRLLDYREQGQPILGISYTVMSLCATTDHPHESQSQTGNYRKKKLNC